MRQSRPAPRPASADAARERPAGAARHAPPVFRAFVRALERLEAERQASRPAREGAR